MSEPDPDRTARTNKMFGLHAETCGLDPAALRHEQYRQGGVDYYCVTHIPTRISAGPVLLTPRGKIEAVAALAVAVEDNRRRRERLLAQADHAKANMGPDYGIDVTHMSDAEFVRRVQEISRQNTDALVAELTRLKAEVEALRNEGKPT